MKRLLMIPFSLLIALPFAVQGQNEPKAGIKGGLNLSNFYRNEVEDENARLGFHAGVYYKAPLGEFVSLQPELLYTTKGADLSDGGFVNEASLNLNYLEFPLLLVFDIGEAVTISAGPYAAYLLNDPSADLDTDLVDANIGLDRDSFKRFDYGVGGGLGFNLNPVTIGIRYSLGLNNIGNENLTGDILDNTKNSALQFYIAL